MIWLAHFSIAPGATVTADFQVKGSDTASAWHAVDIEYTGAGGDLAGMVLVHRKAGVETQPLSASAGKSYVGTQWLSAAEASTAIRVVNVGRKPADYSVTFFAPDSSILYEAKGSKLKPGEDALVDVGQLREQAIPDPQGRRMPGSAEGTFEVEAPDDSDGVLFTTSATRSASLDAVRTAPLTWCCGRVDPILVPGPWNALVKDTGTEVPKVRNTCTDAYVNAFDAYWDEYQGPIISLQASGAQADVTALEPGSAIMTSYVATQLGGLQCGSIYYDLAQAAANIIQATITSADISADVITVNLYPAGITGNLKIQLSGPANPIIFNGSAAGGNHAYSFQRTTLAAGQYTGVTAKWTVGTASSASTHAVNFNVLGIIRHSSYNTPSKPQCPGAPTTGWLITVAGDTCTFTQTEFISGFAAAVVRNGSGRTASRQLIQYYTQCSYPPGANANNSFLVVTQVTGACVKPLTGEQSVARNADSILNQPSALQCNDGLQRVDSTSGTNQGTETVLDSCSGCGVGTYMGTSGHVDEYRSSTACSLIDFGNFLTIRLR